MRSIEAITQAYREERVGTAEVGQLLAALAEREAAVERLRKALAKADETLACIWSSNEESRQNLSHLCAVQASDILRAALADTPEPTP